MIPLQCRLFRARELCQQVGETSQTFPVLAGLWASFSLRAELQTARELGEQLFKLAQSTQDPQLLLQAHYALGQTLFCQGEFVPAREHLEQGSTLYVLQQYRSQTVFIGLDLGSSGPRWVAWVLWILGYPDQALKRNQQALTLARELSHPLSLAFALNWAAWLHMFRREGQTAQERAEAAITLATEQGFAQALATGTILRGWALAEQGQGKEGITQIRQGLTAYQATGAKVAQPHYLAMLAEAYRKVGQAERGPTVLAEALAGVDKTGERSYQAELHRLKGELTLQQFQVSGSKFQVPPNSQTEAEACFHKAIEIARRQSAKSLELRAVMSLSRLWQQQGRKDEARNLLAEIYDWFTEGFDTADLQEARALLEELA